VNFTGLFHALIVLLNPTGDCVLSMLPKAFRRYWLSGMDSHMFIDFLVSGSYLFFAYQSVITVVVVRVARA
jgi:hypothetical protein